ncbi:mechanosensitive ion channel family [Fusarium sporotrichioides]|jgi:small-conductance mechanosensitive channel|uniref:Mechanosensitive ion channel protein n=1 Tax=Fusarium sporotrichioides TaxID=5514 RepID=A0A395SVR7_FUSSP|nr:mechanosensitive ion channel family [Fusarium sporotrichioides]
MSSDPPPNGFFEEKELKDFNLRQPPPSRNPSQFSTQQSEPAQAPPTSPISPAEKRNSAPPTTLDTFPSLQAPVVTNDSNSLRSPIGQRADASRLDDNIELLRIERAVSADARDDASHMKYRTHNFEPEDAFNAPIPSETMQRDKQPDADATLLKFWMFLRKFPRFVRYCLYLVPGAALLLIPVLLGKFALKDDGKRRDVNGVDLMWFGIWLEIVWGVLWVSRMISSILPPTLKLIAKLFGSTNASKWKDIGYQLDLHTAVFLWFLAILISFEPTMMNHNFRDQKPHWVSIMNKVIIALFTLATLNFVEKILIQWIAFTFHQRTYATRIDNNKADVGQLVHLYEHAKAHNEKTDYFFQRGSGSASGAQTPMQTLQDNARQIFDKVGYVAGRVGNDLIGRKIDSNHPRRVVNELLRTTQTAHTLARLIYRCAAKEGNDLVYQEDMERIFGSEEEAEAAFMMFDKDMNGDISIDEFEAVCNEIHLEKKAIAASLKDLDSVIKKLDKVFVFIIIIITIIVFISILSGSAAAALGSAGTVVLGLAWVLQATAQEFLQSIIFVFVKHPFDVGDRVTVYGSTGDNMMGDDFYVTEISLLYTEFKKMQGHIVQAPNSLLNSLFILNQRRSNGLADVVPLVMRFGTPQHMIDDLKERMTEFCLANKRDYAPRIITEMVKVDDVRSCLMNMIFFHKTNFQNELLRLNRHNKFVTELMTQMVNVGIQSPFRIEPGGSREHPMYWSGMQPPPYGKEPDHGSGNGRGVDLHDKPVPHDRSLHSEGPPLSHVPSNYSTRRGGAERMRNMDQTFDFQDVFDNRRENVQAHRLASIREKERGARAEEESERRSLASSSGVERRTSTESRRHVFNRVRTGSRSSKTPGNIV